jgi:carbon monoxide dehydrogenase subunit G
VSIESKGEIVVDIGRETVFGIIGNPTRMAQCIPGCKQLREISPGRYSAVLTSQVAFITLSFDVLVDVIRIDPPAAIETRITGDSSRLGSRVSAKAGVWLEEANERSTLIRYAAQITLAGKLGGLGEPVLRARSADVARKFGANLRCAIENEIGNKQI